MAIYTIQILWRVAKVSDMSSDTVYSTGWNLLNVSTSMDNRRILNDRRITRDEVLSSLVNLRQLTFEVTDACNLQCKYCGYGDLYFGYDKRETKFLAFEQGRRDIHCLLPASIIF